MSKYAKALWAFASTVIGALIIAVSATPNHSLKEVGTLGWLVLAASVLATTGGVYGVANSPPAPPAPPAV